MPKVGGRRYPYTKAGLASASMASKGRSKNGSKEGNAVKKAIGASGDVKKQFKNGRRKRALAGPTGIWENGTWANSDSAFAELDRAVASLRREPPIVDDKNYESLRARRDSLGAAIQKVDDAQREGVLSEFHDSLKERPFGTTVRATRFGTVKPNYVRTFDAEDTDRKHIPPGYRPTAQDTLSRENLIDLMGKTVLTKEDSTRIFRDSAARYYDRMLEAAGILGGLKDAEEKPKKGKKKRGN